MRYFVLVALGAVAAVGSGACGSETDSGGWDELGGHTPTTTTTTSSTSATPTGSSSTTSTGTPTGQGGEAGSAQGGAGGEAGGSGGSGGAPGCDDPAGSEPNETEDNAYQLLTDPINECDVNGSEFEGVIVGPDDVDWFTFRGDDTLSGCVLDLTGTVDSDEPALRLCMYVECLSAETELSGNPHCPAGTIEDTSLAGRPGCCGYSSFEVKYNCVNTTDEDAYIYLLVDVPGATDETCASYTVSYHF